MNLKTILSVLFGLFATIGYSSEEYCRMNWIQTISNINSLDQELRTFEKKQLETALPLIKNKAEELGLEYFERFAFPRNCFGSASMGVSLPLCTHIL